MPTLFNRKRLVLMAAVLLAGYAAAKPAISQNLLGQFTSSGSDFLTSYVGYPDRLDFGFTMTKGSLSAGFGGLHTFSEVGQTFVAPPDVLATFNDLAHQTNVLTYSHVLLSCDNTFCDASHSLQVDIVPFTRGDSRLEFFSPFVASWTLTSVEQTILSASITMSPTIDPNRFDASSFGRQVIRFYGFVPEPATGTLALLTFVLPIGRRHR